jgi:hypothetical protein
MKYISSRDNPLIKKLIKLKNKNIVIKKIYLLLKGKKALLKRCSKSFYYVIFFWMPNGSILIFWTKCLGWSIIN